ncbi:hypothetical protein [Catenulispora pinisilvae]|uniref:hypothetical protein n=1 Tax=Catenulispora pinisilvae TaxID=2705253 RepID=UPI0018913D42|nr:hypothetical protein [Catenulispora pinisilvae]
MSLPGEPPTYGVCLCCRLGNVIMASPRTPDGLPSKVQVCGQCVKHQGGGVHDLRKKEEKHWELWNDCFEQLRDEAEAARQELEDRLQGEISALRQELEERPVHTVEVNEDLVRIEESDKQRISAYYARDMAFQRLSRIKMLHRELETGKCRCRAPGQCKTASLIADDRELNRWEEKQWRLLQNGREFDCMLPQGHQGRTDPRWRPGAA